MVLSRGIIENLKNIQKTKKLAIWGCGRNGQTALSTLIAKGTTVDLCVDVSKTLHGSQFIDSNYVVQPVNILDGRCDEYFVIITPKNCSEAVKMIQSYGYREGQSYVLVNEGVEEELEREANRFYYSQLLSTLMSYSNDYSLDINIVLFPSVQDIHNPSKLEIVLGSYELIISDYFKWIKGNPPHVKEAHKKLSYSDDKYIENIFTRKNPIIIDGVAYQDNQSSEYVNVVSGNRVTINQPAYHDKTVHFIGHSAVYGLGCEDKYTLPSCVQKILQERHRDGYLVVNHGVTGLPIYRYNSKIKSVDFEENDVVICVLKDTADARQECCLAKVPYICLTQYFDRPHDKGEIFSDWAHLNYKGNKYTAEILYQMIFEKAEKSNNPRDAILENNLNRITGNVEFTVYMDKLKRLSESDVGVKGAIVVNCNPFTLGHRFLIEIASKMVDIVYVMVVEEDKSIFPFEDRMELVKKGTSDLENVKVIPSGKFTISNITFPEYFDKDNLQTTEIDPSLDINLFCRYTAKALGVTVRFAGEEPFDQITKQYNDYMRNNLPKYGINFIEIPRKKSSNGVISASRVRKLLMENKLEEIKLLVPESTHDYLMAKQII